MRSNRASGLVLPDLPQQRFVQGLTAGGAIANLDLGGFTSTASAASTALGTAPMLRGTEFNLVIDETPVNFTDKPAMATAISGILPGPTLHQREGNTVTLRVTNRLREPASIHWHGIILPFEMDGVPDTSFHGIPPGEAFTYRFKVRQSGNCWCHSHSDFQETTRVYGTLIIGTADDDAIWADRDYNILLSNWTDEDPMRVLSKLRTQGDYYSYHQPTAAGFFRDVSNDGQETAMEERAIWSQMRMSPTDLADLSNATLTYPANGVTPADNWTGLLTPGETVRLRLINGSGNTFYDVRIPGPKLKVVQVDGQSIEPVTVSEFRFGPGETCDMLVASKGDAYTIFSQSMNRTGYAHDTLTVCRGLQATVPTLDKVEWLSMADIMDDMGGMGDMSHGGMSGIDHGAMSGIDHGGMPGMDYGDMQMMNDTGVTMMGSGDMQMMDHSQHAGSGGAASNLRVSSKTTWRARTRYGPSTDMHVDIACTNLDDPGVGLHNNKHRVLVLADMRTIGGPMDKRDPERRVELYLTGDMEYYTWSFDGVEFGKSMPVHFRYDEWLRVIPHNDTVMTHPVYLHGMWSELEAPGDTFLARRHTILIRPTQRISFLVTADALGRWAWHCRLMLHMGAGIFHEVVMV